MIDGPAAILEAWMMGQAGGGAIADVLFGVANPSGKLAETFPLRLADTPAYTSYPGDCRVARYGEGIFIGYRHYDAKEQPVLFPFGHGLSYTQFRYRDVQVPAEVRAGDSLTVSVEVENAGSVAGEEVVEVYAAAVGAPAPVPIRSLEGFRRVLLAPGERRRETFVLAPRALSLVEADGRRSVTPGSYDVSVGGKQPGLAGAADAATTDVLTARVMVTGRRFELPR